ncbi:Hypothetical predicted protein [Mytilus galloprovincialis]|uniref:Integrase core domain-containing protein n=1 Tax=Mytilus galloprovincialis TaxID=29158 RepID=A0A8B6D2N1_MYTGA|nr:Hypothetical predicted protein [Mytilus galloprovincialis]
MWISLFVHGTFMSCSMLKRLKRRLNIRRRNNQSPLPTVIASSSSKRVYYNRGPNYLIHVDGYDKLKPYGIAIHGAIDGYSRKLLWLIASPSNNNPDMSVTGILIGSNKEDASKVVRSDAGTENVIMRIYKDRCDIIKR